MKILKLFVWELWGLFLLKQKKNVYDFALLGNDVVSWGQGWTQSEKGAKQQWCKDLEV